jgi:hypothetical protein
MNPNLLAREDLERGPILPAAPAVVKCCPRCQSIFIEKDYCEACGFRFKYSELGLPWEKHGIFKLQENLANQLMAIAAMPRWSRKAATKKAYQQFVYRLFRRWHQLITFGPTQTDKRLVHLELETILNEVPPTVQIALANELAAVPELAFKPHCWKMPVLPPPWWRRRLWGVVSVPLWLIFFGTMTAVILMACWVWPPQLVP